MLGIVCCHLILPQSADANDFPTTAKTEYVFACMSGTGENARSLRQCACVIDGIAADLTYDDYVAAETILRMRKLNGEKGSLFRESDSLREKPVKLNNAEVRAKNTCF